MFFKNHFIKNYEKYVYQARKEYYENITIYNKGYSLKNIVVFFPYIAAIVAAFLLFTNGFHLEGIITAGLCIVVVNLIIKIIERFMKLEDLSNYENAIRRLGYFNIDSYEIRLRFFVTGKFGLYTKQLEEYKRQYDLNENSKTVMDINGNLFYIFLDSKMDKIIFLPATTNLKPKLDIIKYGSIRYYRVDLYKQMVILKTNNNEYFFKMSALPIFKSVIEDKDFNNLHSFHPEDYISDFELYMHRVKSDLNKKSNINKEITFTSTIKMIILSFIIAICYIVSLKLNKYLLLLHAVMLVSMFLISLSFYTFIHYISSGIYSDDDYLKYFKHDKNVLERFQELKVSLNIFDKYDTIYNLEGTPYLTWYCNGYFHLFLNIPYFNVVYMVINPKTINYYRVEGNECVIKMGEQSLVFKRSAYKVLAKVLPNKDYEWLRKIEKRNH